jgi:hypothetical protein
MKFDDLINKLLSENETENKNALLTVRLPFDVKDDLQRIATERKVKMTTVVETYFVAGRAMEKMKIKFPILHEKIVNAQSPEEIEQILQSLISKEVSLESTMVEEGFLQVLKDKLSDATTSVKSVLMSLSKFLGSLVGSPTPAGGIPLLSDILFAYNQSHQSH